MSVLEDQHIYSKDERIISFVVENEFFLSSLKEIYWSSAMFKLTLANVTFG